MKKFLSFLLIIAAVLVANNSFAQTTLTETDPAGATSTVNTNGDTSYHSITLTGTNNNFDKLHFVLKGTKLTGTISGGTATLWGSMDNSRWFAVYAQTNASTADTTTSHTLTDGDTNFDWIVTNTVWAYYRVRVITTGTQTSGYDVKVLGRKVPN